MNGLDLFSGIGGITKAFEGYVRPVAYCENDRYAQSVLLSRMADGRLPRAPIWDDITSLKGSMLPQGINIIYGGFPCQDISVVGRREGLGGKRSGLFFEIIRLVKEIQPTFIFLENVAGIRTRGGQAVIDEFSRLRYDCRWGMLSAYDVGAPHKRERWWMLAHANGEHDQRGAESQFTNSAGGTTRAKPRRMGNKILDTTSEGLPDWIGGKMGQPTPITQFKRSDGREIERDFCGMAHGVSLRVDRLRGLGNAVVPAQAREAFERLMGLK